MSNQTKSNSTEDLRSILLANRPINVYTDKLCLFLIIPMGILGTVFNLISFSVFCKKTFGDVALFKYLRVYTFSSLIVSSSLIFSFYFSPYTLPELLLAYSTRIYACQLAPSYVIIFFFLYENVIDIFINIERALCFSNGFKRYKKISPYLICFILFFVCILINGPNYLLYDIIPDSELATKERICALSGFVLTPVGQLLLMISYIIQGPVVLGISVGTNLIAVISYRKFLKKKAQTRFTNNKNKDNETSAKEKREEKMNRSLLLMTVYLNILSAIYHLIQFSAQFSLFIFFLSNWLAAWFVFTGMFIFSLKSILNIFFYYHYNNKFKEALLFCVKKPTREDATIITRVK